VFVASLIELPRPGPPPIANLTIERSVGMNGTRLSAALTGTVVGYIEVDTLVETNKLALQGGLADVGNLHVEESHRRRGIATWLLAQAAEWLRSAGVERLLDYARPEQTEYIAFLEQAGFRELTRTQRGWIAPPSPPAAPRSGRLAAGPDRGRLEKRVTDGRRRNPSSPTGD